MRHGIRGIVARHTGHRNTAYEAVGHGIRDMGEQVQNAAKPRQFWIYG